MSHEQPDHRPPRCVWCSREGAATQPPPASDDAAWRALASYHVEWCAWLVGRGTPTGHVRAHPRQASDGGIVAGA